MKKDIIMVTSFCNTPEKIELLDKLIKNLKSWGKKVFLVTHLNVPGYILKNTDLYFYDSDNELIYDKEFMGSVWVRVGDIVIDSKTPIKYTTGLAVLKSIYNGFNIAKMNGFDIVHHIEFDTLLNDPDEIEDNNRLIREEEYGAINYVSGGWMHGNYFVLDVSKYDYFDVSREKTLETIKTYTICEEYLKNHVVGSRKHLSKDGEILKKKYYQQIVNEAESLLWAVVGELDGEYYCFLYNINDIPKKYNVIIDDKNLNVSLNHKGACSLSKIEGTPKIVKIFCNNKLYREFDFENPDHMKEINVYTTIKKI